MFFGSVRNVFASRWKALLWAAGVMLTAYCTIPSPDPSPADKAAAQAQQHINPWSKHKDQAAPQPTEDAIAELKDAIAKATQGPPEEHVNPWAKKTDKPAN